MHISEKQEKIIVLQQFDNVIAANLAKTKLDAYDVPCFLTDENFVSLYPIQNDIFPGVRLCIFEKDEVQAREVLKEHNLLTSSDNDDQVRCPHCQSTNVVHSMSRKSMGNRVIVTILKSLFIQSKTKYCCEDCNREFSSR